jgi:hypothetical protein
VSAKTTNLARSYAGNPDLRAKLTGFEAMASSYFTGINFKAFSFKV